MPASVLQCDSFTADQAGQAPICLNVKYKATRVDHWAKPSAFRDTGFVSRLKESLVQKNVFFFPCQHSQHVSCRSKIWDQIYRHIHLKLFLRNPSFWHNSTNWPPIKNVLWKTTSTQHDLQPAICTVLFKQSVLNLWKVSAVCPRFVDFFGSLAEELDELLIMNLPLRWGQIPPTSQHQGHCYKIKERCITAPVDPLSLMIVRSLPCNSVRCCNQLCRRIAQ